MNDCLFDSSAVLAAILDEPGGDRAHELMSLGHISIVNLCEIYSKLIESGLTAEASEKLVGRFQLRVRAFRDPHALEAARLRPISARHGLSMGYRICLATARIESLPVVTADRRWRELDLGVEIHFIR